MEKPLQIFVRLRVVFIITFLVASSTTALSASPQKELFSSVKQTMNHSSCSSNEIELKYYMEEGLDLALGVATIPPVVWKSAIRLTQDEMGPYLDWTMTNVNVAFSGESTQSEIDVRIFIYAKGTSPTHPGPIIVNDTTAHLDTTGITTIPLVTPVNLSGYEELWVAVEWYQTALGPYIMYALMDTLTGPAVDQKGDFYFLNNAWGEIQTGGPEFDGNWGIGAIIEYYSSELSIGNIKGPIGIKANVSNTGEYMASDVQWSILVTGGLLKRVKESAMGNMTTLDPATSVLINLSPFSGFGKISIVIKAKALNANEVVETKSAFLLGPFIIGIR